MNKLTFGISMLAATMLSPAAISNSMDDVVIKAQQVSNNVYMLAGAGGNIGVLLGAEGTLMIDDQFEPLAPKIEQAIANIESAKQPKVSYVVNTHYHGDHSGGNVYFSKSASLLAHENVRKRLAKKSDQGLPVITYESGVKLHLNNEDVHVMHLPAGHTDGDSVVYFANANVWHLGDLFFQNRFPYIDTDGGGSVKGYIQNISSLLLKIDESAPIIPGHGELANKKDLQNLLSMIIATKLEVQTKRAKGDSLEDVIKAGLSEKWSSWHWSFITEEKWIKTLYNSK